MTNDIWNWPKAQGCIFVGVSRKKWWLDIFKTLNLRAKKIRPCKVFNELIFLTISRTFFHCHDFANDFFLFHDASEMHKWPMGNPGEQPKKECNAKCSFLQKCPSASNASKIYHTVFTSFLQTKMIHTCP